VRKPTAISIEYPGEGEIIDSPTYSFRIDAQSPRVEIAIDGGGWTSCRRGDEYWWFDWSDYEPGLHQAIVREAPDAGPAPPSGVRRFVVGRPERRAR